MNIIQKFKQVRKAQWGTLLLRLLDNIPIYSSPIADNAIKVAVTNAKSKNKQRNKAFQRANRNTKAPMLENNTAKLQEALFNIGAYEKGRTFEQEVDGVIGNRTKRAIQKAEAMGYIVDKLKGTVTAPKVSTVVVNDSSKNNSKNNNSKSNFFDLYSMTHLASTGGFSGTLNLPFTYLDSLNTGLLAIFDHKRNLNVNKNYAVIDKKNKTLNIYNKDRLLESHPVTIGMNVGDGLLAPDTKYYSQASGTTGAGVFTVDTYPDSPYLGNEPVIRLRSDTKTSGLVLSIHSPASMDRLNALRNPSRSKRVSFGCISPDCGVMTRLYNDKILQDNDTVYILPEISGNELIEKDKKLQMSWGKNNPLTYNNGKKRFVYNNKK